METLTKPTDTRLRRFTETGTVYPILFMISITHLLNDMMPALSNDTIHPVFVHSPLNAIKWYVKDDALYLVPNLNLMLKNDPSKAQLGPLDPGTITTVGIPLYFKKEGDKMTVYVSKEQTAPVFGLLSTVISMIDPSFELSLGGSSLPLRLSLIHI